MADDEEKLISEPDQNEVDENDKTELIANGVAEGKEETSKATSNTSNHKEKVGDKHPPHFQEPNPVVQPLLTGKFA